MAKRGVVGNRLDFIERMVPTLVDGPPEGEDWLHELKLDGYRSQIVLKLGEALAYSPAAAMTGPTNTADPPCRGSPGLPLGDHRWRNDRARRDRSHFVSRAPLGDP